MMPSILDHEGTKTTKRHEGLLVENVLRVLLVLRVFVIPVGVGVTSVATMAQTSGLDPATLLKPLGDQWPSYSGDYTGRRYSTLTQINQATVKSLSLAWVARITGGAGSGPAAKTID